MNKIQTVLNYLENLPAVVTTAEMSATIYTILTTKARGKPAKQCHPDEYGRATHIWCNTHKQWEPVAIAWEYEDHIPISSVYVFARDTRSTTGHLARCKQNLTVKGSPTPPTQEDINRVSLLLDIVTNTPVKLVELDGDAPDQAYFRRKYKRSGEVIPDYHRSIFRYEMDDEGRLL